MYNNLTNPFRKTSFGTKGLIIVLDHGYSRRRAETKDTRNHGQHHYMVARHTTNQEVSHRPLLNLECILLLDTSLVAIRPNHLSTRWQKLCPCSNQDRSLFPIWTWSAQYRMSCVQLISIRLPNERSVVSLKVTLEWIWPRVRQLSMLPLIALFWIRTNSLYISTLCFAIVNYMVSPLFFSFFSLPFFILFLEQLNF